MNAGAMGWETFDLVEWVTFLMPDGQIRKISRSDMEVAYRFCKEASEGIALRAKLNADGKADHQVIREAIDKLSQSAESLNHAKPVRGVYLGTQRNCLQVSLLKKPD